MAMAMAMANVFGSSKMVHTGLEGKTGDAFRVRKHQPFIHASCNEGNHDQVESIVEDEGGEGRRRTHRYKGLQKSHQGTDRDNEMMIANMSEIDENLSKRKQ
jgi:hypothetical protein